MCWWVMSDNQCNSAHINKSCHTSTSLDTCVDKSYHTHEWVTSHTQIFHVTESVCSREGRNKSASDWVSEEFWRQFPGDWRPHFYFSSPSGRIKLDQTNINESCKINVVEFLQPKACILDERCISGNPKEVWPSHSLFTLIFYVSYASALLHVCSHVVSTYGVRHS